MRPNLEIISRTQLPIHFNQLQERIYPDSYSPRRSIFTPQKEKSLVPLKQFQEYFGKTKPNFYQELKNIFAHAQIEDFSPSVSVEEPFCRIQGSILASRARSLKKRKQGGQSNNFTIEKSRGNEIYRKARLNKLIKMQWQLEDQSLQDEDANAIIRQSVTIVQELKDVMKTRRTITPVHHRRRSFRLSQSVDRQNLLFQLNPDSKEVFTLVDLHKAIAVLHSTTIKISPNLNYFNVYIEEGNNSQLLKMLVRRRAGWRVVEIPAIANFIWTQFYRKNTLKKRLNKRQKFPTDLESKLARNSTFKAGKVQTKTIQPEAYSLPASGESTFMSEVRKLIPEAEDVKSIKMGWSKSFEEIYVNHNVLVHNHFPQNRCITDKKNLLQNLTVYYSTKNLDVFQFLPESYQLIDLQHPILKDLEAKVQEKERWIIKPGENSNRGRGIIVAQSNSETLQQLFKRFQTNDNQLSQKNPNRSVVLQRYLIPLLYNGRKFDIRSYMLVTFLNNQIRVYCYDECYIRTSSRLFDIESTNRLVHLTNDAVQAQSGDYGKFQEGNKLAESTFSRFIDEEYKKKKGKGSIWKDIRKEMEARCIDAIQASYQTLVAGWKQSLEQENDRKQFCFELFGMDFMIDQRFKLWLIEVNTNPAISHDCSKVLNLLIPKMLDNMLSLAVEPIMRPQRVPETPFFNRFKAVFKRSLS